MKSYFAEHAWLGGESCASNVRITVDKGSFVSIDANAAPNSKDSRIDAECRRWGVDVVLQDKAGKWTTSPGAASLIQLN